MALRNITAILLVLWSGTSFAQRDIQQVESVLERLEKRLLDEEGETLTFGERELPPATLPKAEADKKIAMPPAKIEGEAEDASRMREITTAVSQLENQVDQLLSDVGKTRQKIMEDARVDNEITIEAALGAAELASIRSMRVKLDGYDIYDVSDDAGLWVPTNTVPLYFGPLQAGNHRLDLEVRMVLKQREGLPVNSDVYRFVSQSFELKIPDGRTRTRYVVRLAAPRNAGEKASATLEIIKSDSRSVDGGSVTGTPNPRSRG